jgi:hypothetical protein
VNTVARFLAPAGRLVLAIENQLGLKYFNGCAEDHIGLPFFGVEGLYAARGPVTYGRRELASKLQACGFAALEWFYPFPDYKLPTLVVSARAFETPDFNVADLLARVHARDYGGHCMRLFEEALAFSTLHRNGLLEDFSNSFMLVAGRSAEAIQPSNAIAWTYALNRHERFATQTAFVRDGGRVLVTKTPLSATHNAHGGTQDHASIRQVLAPAVYSPGRLSIWRVLEANARDASLEEMTGAFMPWFDELLSHASASLATEAEVPSRPVRLADYQIDGALVDLTPYNLVEGQCGFSIIDQEWQLPDRVPLGQVVCRSVFHSLTAPLFRSRTYDLADVVQCLCASRRLAVTSHEIGTWLGREREFLRAVGASAPSASTTPMCRSHLRAIYPELVRGVQEASDLRARVTLLQGELDSLRLVHGQLAAQSETRHAELEAALRERGGEIAILRRIRDSQAGMLAALTRDLADQAATVEPLAIPPSGDQQLAGDLAAARASLEQMRSERDAAREATAVLELANRHLTASTSWRVTSPLRALKTAADRFARRMRRWGFVRRTSAADVNARPIP